ncbi:hypothetical protein [Frankia sp. CiP3]|uniref:hypothetical protein n=1 Tax=Frankia sp. CiP3 TaxID=2880971 RepID=UPI001EF4D2C8|nr:hypothetical protein [Frankia sp. CiP3]
MNGQEDTRGARVLTSKITGGVDLRVSVGVDTDELIRVLETYVPGSARLRLAMREGQELVFRFERM